MARVMSVSDLRENLATTLEQIKRTPNESGIVLVSTHKEAGVALINQDFLEDLLDSVHPETVAAIEQARADIKAGRTYSLEQVLGELEGV